MMKCLIAIWLFSLFFYENAFSQTFSVKGKVADETDSVAAIGSTIRLISQSDTMQIAGAVSDVNGFFNIKNITPGNYALKVTYEGSEQVSRNISVINNDLNLGVIVLKSSHMLQDVVIKGRIERAVQLGDTTQFNAAAFKTNPDASAEDLLTKMPGVTSDNTGLKVNGEKVTKIYVDGKLFFGSDPAVAMKTLPAEVIDKIQVYDKQTDQAQFTGFDDGNSEKAINIITKKDKKNGKFGKLYAGIGTDNHYNAGGTVNTFGGSRRLSFVGLSNNINQQNFSNDAMATGKGGGSNGITTSNSIGVNYTDEWGDKIKVAGSYFLSGMDNNNKRELFRQYYQNDSFTYSETSHSESKDNAHKFNFRLEYTIDSNNSLFWVPTFSYQTGNNTSDLMAANNQGTGTSTISNQKQSGSNSYNLGNDFTYNHRFHKKGRTISIDFEEQTSDNQSNGSVYSLNKYTDSTTLLNQRYTQSSSGQQVSGGIRYTEPISKTSQLMVNYNPSYSKNLSNKSTNDYNAATESYIIFDTLLSNKYDNIYIKQRAGLAYRFRKNKLHFMVGINAQSASLKGDQDFPKDFTLQKKFTNILPAARFNYRPAKGENLRVDYYTSTNAPGIAQLQSVVDISNPLLLNTGNPDLQQSVSHKIRFRYGKTNVKTATSFSVFANFSMEQGHISNARFIPTQDTVFMNVDVNKGGQISIPINLDGYVNSNTNATYSIPLDLIKTNFNFSGGFSYGKSPSRINDVINSSSSYTPNLGLVLSSNISESVDFTLGYRGNYNIVKNTALPQSDNNYYNHQLSLKVNLILLSRLVINSNINESLYSGLSQGYNQQYFIWNAYVGYKFMRNKALEARVTAFDILNQNKSINVSMEDIYREQTNTRVLTQYLMFNLNYTFRYFKSGGPDKEDLINNPDEG